jgi:hypothetical protein
MYVLVTLASKINPPEKDPLDSSCHSALTVYGIEGPYNLGSSKGNIELITRDD